MIRKEEKRDFQAVYELVKAAFATTGYSDGSEADRVEKNRKADFFIPELSLVAEEAGEIVGYIALHTMEIKYKDRCDTQLEVAPLAVRPDHFKKGIGSALMEEAHKRALDMGYSCVFLLGNPAYYPRFGYEPTYKHNIFYVNDKTKKAEACMVKELKKGYLGFDEAYIDIE